ncbi:hypothetical protein [Streptomyces sp. NPDC006668]|uniref:hypothetical protein n=1 Tax=Streptomyces sp. NPDC006668 TaxID=3156903 RepID=UPI0033D17DA0
MPTDGIREQIDRARRLIADYLSNPAARRRQEKRLAAWNEPADAFLETAGLVLALALYQAHREAAGELLLETNRAFWESVTARLAPDASAVALFAGMPAGTDPDAQRQIQALRLTSAGISPTTGIRWLRLLQTARDVAQHQL